MRTLRATAIEVLPGESMGLYDKLINKVVGNIYAKKLDRDLQGLVDQGRMTQDEVDRVVADFKSETGRSTPSNGTRKINCCSTCKYFSWGECWYYYEGNPGFNYSQYHRYNYHGETQKINYPDGSICDNFRRDANK